MNISEKSFLTKKVESYNVMSETPSIMAVNDSETKRDKID